MSRQVTAEVDDVRQSWTDFEFGSGDLLLGRAHPGGVVRRPRTGGTVDTSTTVASPAIHSNSETVRSECETGGRSVVRCPREEDSA